MRINKYRGRRSYNKEWIYGSLLIDNNGDFHILESDVVEKDGHHIYIDSDSPMFFDNDTVGQFTGLYDKNGKEIYEGNIIEISDSMMLQFRNTIIEGYKNFGIIFYGGNFVLRPWLDECYYNTFRNNSWRLGNIYSQDMKIIGNIYENPELLERE